MKDAFERLTLYFAVLLGVLLVGVLLLGYRFYLSPEARWRQRFEVAMKQTQEARLADPVDFKWDQIFVLEAHDPIVPLKLNEILGSNTWSYESPGYWTIVYLRPGATTFAVQMKSRQWFLANAGYRWTSDQSATLRAVLPGTPEASKCSRHPRLEKCLIPDDVRTR